MATITKIEVVLEAEKNKLLQRVARLYDVDNRIVAEYLTVPKPIPDQTECLKRSFIYNSQSQIIGEQVKVDVWTQLLEDLASPPITNIQINNLSISPGLPSGTKIGDILVEGGVYPFNITLTNNPGNLFRIDNTTDLVLNAPSSSGTYPITIEVMDDDSKIESQNFNIEVTSFSNSKSMQGDGVDEYVDFGTNSDFQFEKTSTFSVSGWIKIGTVLAGTSILGNFASESTPRGWRVITGVSGTKVLGLQLSFSSSNQFLVHSTSQYTDGLWHNFVITYNGSELSSGIKIYVDGLEVPVTVFSNNLTSSISTTNSLRAFSTSDSTPSQVFNGNLDELAIWNKVLSNSEVSELYGTGQTTDLNSHSAHSNLIHWYRMGDDDLFPTIPDKKGLNNGTAINMELLDVKEDTP